MEIISKEKPKEEFVWEYFTRCENIECQVLLKINEFDVIAECVGHDLDFGTPEYEYYYKCPECGKVSEFHGGAVDDLAKEIAKRKLLRRK